ncbi:hypothetical protein SCLCIDRAFT_32280 [Scleroderma citrinum Foug A]|uniref:Heterokaryon incompatibility domain-containing protein n=1 Tax=Scleroderma citrinum Foug A TaxID=1036808 RepID=A0A0C3DA06_9AGAM|nr:hypothetical protein SCLCIDRAFT_32280 [Scleroderma citrinum Foug A]
MCLINVEAFLKRESLMKMGKSVDRRTKVLEFGNDEAAEYAILSHRWMAQEVDYDEMILQSCEQARANGYEWLWVDTCCIDKRSSAELSEAINSMHQWYENAKRYPDFRGWPEWFLHGWTLQELIAPSNVEFFNKNWHSIGDKRTLAPTLIDITGVLEHVLMDGLHGNHPCIAQIMSWAAHRKMTQVKTELIC